MSYVEGYVEAYLEAPLLFDCAGATLPAIVTLPPGSAASQDAGIGVLIVAGGYQYRIGSHRQFVLLARRLAGHGYAAMRFDRCGIGDGGGDRLPFSRAEEEIGAAIAAFREACPGLRKIVLCGLCDGASAALIYWRNTRDPLIAGMSLLNPWARSETVRARALVKHYYLRRLGQADFWRKVLSGKFTGARAARELAGNLAGAARGETAAMPDWQAGMAGALQEYPGPILLLLSELDQTAHEFTEWMRAAPDLRAIESRPAVTRRVIAGADHTFSTGAWRTQAEQAMLEWLGRIGRGA
jgi:exosortase A-associated hydrolase 1